MTTIPNAAVWRVWKLLREQILNVLITRQKAFLSVCLVSQLKKTHSGLLYLHKKPKSNWRDYARFIYFFKIKLFIFI